MGKWENVKFVQTDRQTDRRTAVKHYAPDLSIRGHKNFRLVQIETRCVCETQMPRKQPFFGKCNLNI